MKTRVLLLVEDNPADAELVVDMLDGESGASDYQIYHTAALSEARSFLESNTADVVLLDLRLPDMSGVESLREILTVAPSLPVVVLTGIEDEALALRCIDEGAQDYLKKDELKPALLRRTIGYAITRLRENQIRQLQTLLEHYRALSSEGRKTGITAEIAGVGALRDRQSDEVAAIVVEYRGLLEGYIRQLDYRLAKPAGLMHSLATRIGDLDGGPRDLVDIHVSALEAAIDGLPEERTHYYVIEGRLLALEMMGLLVDYYRVGQRRRFTGGER